MSYAYNTRKKNIKNKKMYVDPADYKIKYAISGKKRGKDNE